MQNPEQPYTLEEYWKLVETFPDHKYEYVDGFVRMMTGGTLPHSHIAMNLSRIISTALLDRECLAFGSDAAVSLSESRVYYPDLTVTCDPADWSRTKSIESPTIVIEVLSPGTQSRDKLEKLDAYQLYPTIQDILLIDSKRMRIGHYHRVDASSWNYIIYTSKDDVVALEVIDLSITVADIYYRVYLTTEE
ncbi:Uma2 family endonuclease [Tengunoibacter tsumagoiensis]|uniref:Putative restriction endonuclease domain-containing protein n=1 Tax=Tengunoibacter tsumagoiensis TaxID=2014871 RepID=A0A401ZY84_9CHLR|nr:Uma2 family endonuclease [Tengunoibacter tsumagoiensis]GCE11816.1 hypothetical protein KTT_16750 [Tengunoibacter tsumagoiensis]